MAFSPTNIEDLKDAFGNRWFRAAPNQCVAQPIFPTAITNTAALATSNQGFPLAVSTQMPVPNTAAMMIQARQAIINFMREC